VPILRRLRPEVDPHALAGVGHRAIPE
jgi:hypothetical protein